MINSIQLQIDSVRTIAFYIKTVFLDCSILKKNVDRSGYCLIGRVGASGEWAQKALCLMEELYKHLATGEGGEEVVFVAF